MNDIDWGGIVFWVCICVMVTTCTVYENKACASESNLVIHGISKHVKNSSDDNTSYNESNNTLGYEYISGKHGVAGGAYEDSYNTTAKYIGGLYLPYQSRHTKWGLLYGFVKSPSYQYNNTLFMAIPYASVMYNGVGANFMYLPKFTSRGAHVIGIQFKLAI